MEERERPNLLATSAKLFDLDSEQQKADPSAAGNGQIIVGDALKILKTFEASSFQSCITSPPYWGLRDYGIPGQIGAERRVDTYIDHLVKAFREVRRVLRDDGTLWLNIGDSYTSGGRTWRQADRKNPARGMDYRAPTPKGLKPKDLIGVPWRLAFALQADGWYLRTDIVWHKPNAQPESVKDRPARSHEYVFLLTKNEDYFYDHASVAEDGLQGPRNKRSVWSINTEPFPEAHFATFPRALVLPCIQAGTKPGSTILDPFFGSGTVGEVALLTKRSFVGIELQSEYAEIAHRRILRGCHVAVPIQAAQGPRSRGRRTGLSADVESAASARSRHRNRDGKGSAPSRR